MKQELKDRAFKFIDSNKKTLLKASHSIHENPELCYKEKHACQVLCDVISDAGIEVEKGAYGLETAFVARAGKAGPQIAILCEYDALEGLGHACGHNVIGTAGLGAGLAASQLADELNGRVAIIGTPAEEGGGGKVKLLENGAFEGIDAAIMLHPSSKELTKMNTQGVRQVLATYTGKPSHASGAPHMGINALDAAVNAYNSIAALRQHIRPEERINGILLEGGNQVNVIPDRAKMHYQIRSDTFVNLQELIPRVMNCFEAAATATGCTLEVEIPNPDYIEMWDNEPLLASYIDNASLVNRSPQEPDPTSLLAAGTDMGNVSQQVPSIHPLMKIAPLGTRVHTKEFAVVAGEEGGDQGVIDGAKMLAAVAIDYLSDESLRVAVAEDFERQKATGKYTGNYIDRSNLSLWLLI